MRQLPHLTELAANPALHVVGLYDQIHPLDQIEHMLKKYNVNFPNTPDIGTFAAAGYISPALPKVWIVGVDGTFIFIGNKDYDEILEKELAKVKYPGLGKTEVHKDVVPAATAYGKGSYAEAWKLAEAVYDDTDDDKVEADADYIMDRIRDRISQLEVRAETAEVTRDYNVAIACWRELATRYKGLEDTEEAPARLKKLTDDEAVSKDVAARHALLALGLKLDVDASKVDAKKPEDVLAFRKKCLTEYQTFYNDNKDNSAGELAHERIETLESGIPKPPPERIKTDKK